MANPTFEELREMETASLAAAYQNALAVRTEIQEAVNRIDALIRDSQQALRERLQPILLPSHGASVVIGQHAYRFGNSGDLICSPLISLPGDPGTDAAR